MSPTTVLSAPCGTKIVTGEGIALTVNHRSNILDGIAETVVLTEDGRLAVTSEWHSGPEAATVFVERWSVVGREFHGFIDSASRRLVQAG